MIFIQLVFVQFVILGVLLAVLRYLMKRHIGSASSHFQALTEDCTLKLEEAKKQKEDANEFYNRTLAKAKEEGDKSRQELIQEGHKIRDEIIEQARKQSLEMTNRAQVASENMVAEIEQRIDARAKEKMHQLIQELLPGKMSEETHSYWVKSLIQNGFEGLKRLNISDQAQEAQVITAFPLKPDEKKMLIEELNKKIGRTVRLKEEINPEAILGIRVMFDNLVIDGTLQFKIQESLRQAESENASPR